MTTIELAKTKRLDGDTVVCLGFFDGVHLGHAQLVARAVEIGRQNGLAVCVHTFDQMPARVLNPQAQITELTPLPHKAALLAALGVDILAISAFCDTVNLSPGAFFSQILEGKLRARHIVCGFHHRFGHRGEGDVALLGRLCAQAGIGLDVIEPVTLPDGELISSTAIREAIRAGDRAKVARMLGRDTL